MHHLSGTGLHCAPLTCVVHHRPVGTFYMFVINAIRDGAQYDAVSLAVYVHSLVLTKERITPLDQ